MKVLKLLLLVGIFAMSTNVYAGGETATDSAILNQNIVTALTFSLGNDVTFTQAAQNTGAATKTLTVTMAGTADETVLFNYDTSVTMTSTTWTAADATKEIVVTVSSIGTLSSNGGTVTLTGGVGGGELRLAREAIASNDVTGDYNKTLNATITYNSL